MYIQLRCMHCARSINFSPDVHARADVNFAPSQWETVLLCNDVFYWLGANLGSALHTQTRNVIDIWTLIFLYHELQLDHSWYLNIICDCPISHQCSCVIRKQCNLQVLVCCHGSGVNTCMEIEDDDDNAYGHIYLGFVIRHWIWLPNCWCLFLNILTCSILPIKYTNQLYNYTLNLGLLCFWLFFLFIWAFRALFCFLLYIHIYICVYARDERICT